MKAYKYIGKNSDGIKIEGQIWADTIDEVQTYLIAQEIFIISIQAVKSTKSYPLSKRKRWSYRTIISFSYQMGLMLDSGISIKQILNLLIKQGNQLVSYEFILECLQRGVVLSEILKSMDFPLIGVTLIQAGELSGDLAKTFWLIRDYYEKEKKARDDLLAALAYPSFLLVVMVCFALGMVLFILPSFEEVFTSMNAPLPKLTAYVFNLCHYIRDHGQIIGLILVLLVSSLAVGITNTRVKNLLDRYIWLKLSKLEFYGGIYYGRLANIWSILLDSGIPIKTTLQITKNLWGNSYARNCHQKMAEEIERGQTLSSSMKNNQLGSTFLWELIFIGEESGELVNMLQHIAEYYNTQNTLWRKKMQKILEPVLLSFMGISIGFLVITVMLPMFNSISIMTNL